MSNPIHYRHKQKFLTDYGLQNPTSKQTNEANEKMVKLSEEAKNYESPTTKNIADLDSVEKDVE